MHTYLNVTVTITVNDKNHAHLFHMSYPIKYARGYKYKFCSRTSMQSALKYVKSVMHIML